MSCEMLDWMNSKVESRLSIEISATSYADNASLDSKGRKTLLSLTSSALVHHYHYFSSNVIIYQYMLVL